MQNQTVLKDLGAILKQEIATHEGFPKPGISFKDIQSVLMNPRLTRSVLDASVKAIKEEKILPNAILGFDARGFLFGLPLAMRFGVPLIMARKANKLPGELTTTSFEKEYGTDSLSVQKGLIKPGMHVLVHDDLLATGGTAKAANHLIEEEGGVLCGFHFIMELGYLDGRKELESLAPVVSMVNFATSKD